MLYKMCEPEDTILFECYLCKLFWSPCSSLVSQFPHVERTRYKFQALYQYVDMCWSFLLSYWLSVYLVGGHLVWYRRNSHPFQRVGMLQDNLSDRYLSWMFDVFVNYLHVVYFMLIVAVFWNLHKETSGESFVTLWLSCGQLSKLPFKGLISVQILRMIRRHCS
jgi:hypothetical protein